MSITIKNFNNLMDTLVPNNIITKHSNQLHSLYNYALMFPITANEFERFLSLSFDPKLNVDVDDYCANIIDIIDKQESYQIDLLTEQAFLDFLERFIQASKTSINRLVIYSDVRNLPELDAAYNYLMFILRKFFKKFSTVEESFYKKYEKIIEDNLPTFTEKLLLRIDYTNNEFKYNNIVMFLPELQLVVPFSKDFIRRHAEMFIPECVAKSIVFKTQDMLEFYLKECLPIAIDVRSMFYTNKHMNVKIDPEMIDGIVLQHIIKNNS